MMEFKEAICLQGPQSWPLLLSHPFRGSPSVRGASFSTELTAPREPSLSLPHWPQWGVGGHRTLLLSLTNPVGTLPANGGGNERALGGCSRAFQQLFSLAFDSK